METNIKAKSPGTWLLVTTPEGKQYNDVIKYKSLELYVDVEFKPGEHALRIAEVVSPPGAFETGIVEGDKVFLHHNALIEDDFKMTTPEGDAIFSVEYGHVLAIIRDEEILAPAGRVLTLPIDRPPRKSMYEPKPKEWWDNQRAKVYHLGPQFMNYTPPEIKKGDIIFFTEEADWLHNYNGIKFFSMLHSDCLAIWKE